MSQKFFSKSLSLVALFFVSLISAVSGQDLNSPLPFDTTVTTGTLSNGLKYYIKPNPKPEKKVSKAAKKATKGKIQSITFVIQQQK